MIDEDKLREEIDDATTYLAVLARGDATWAAVKIIELVIARPEVEPLFGRTIVADKPCPACGDCTAIVEPHHYHLAHLPCAACGRRGRWLSHWQAWRLLHPGQEWFRKAPPLPTSKPSGGAT